VEIRNSLLQCITFIDEHIEDIMRAEFGKEE
jgi:hypothetical protein